MVLKFTKNKLKERLSQDSIHDLKDTLIIWDILVSPYNGTEILVHVHPK